MNNNEQKQKRVTKVKPGSKKRKHPHSPMPYWDPFSHKVDWRPK